MACDCCPKTSGFKTTYNKRIILTTDTFKKVVCLALLAIASFGIMRYGYIPTITALWLHNRNSRTGTMAK